MCKAANALTKSFGPQFVIGSLPIQYEHITLLELSITARVVCGILW